MVARAVPQTTPASLAAELAQGIGDVSSAEHSYRLWELSRLARQSPQVMAFLAEGTGCLATGTRRYDLRQSVARIFRDLWASGRL